MLAAQPEGQGSDVDHGWAAKTLIKKAEVQYTENVEAGIKEPEEKGKALEVTHNVSLDGVKRNIARWIEPSKKEYINLREKKKAFKTIKRGELPENCSIVPGKAVCTVKLDKGGYRRKARFVACGNHIPADQLLGELYAAGVDAVGGFNGHTPSLCPGSVVWKSGGHSTSISRGSDGFGTTWRDVAGSAGDLWLGGIASCVVGVQG